MEPGSVRAGPTCSVEVAGQPCAPAPVAGASVELLRDGIVLASTHTNARGRFRLPAEPGDLVVQATTADGLPSLATAKVTLTEGSTATSRLLLDTGIR